jgi:hypothetical protein
LHAHHAAAKEITIYSWVIISPLRSSTPGNVVF